MSNAIKAKITIEFTISNIIHQDDLDNFYGKNEGITLEEFFKQVVENDELWDYIGDWDKMEMVKVEEII